MADIRKAIETGVTAQPSNLPFIMGRKGGGDKATANHDADLSAMTGRALEVYVLRRLRCCYHTKNSLSLIRIVFHTTCLNGLRDRRRGMPGRYLIGLA